jgi:cytochrome c
VQAIATRYASRTDAPEALRQGILLGSEGKWGRVAMPPQRVSEEEADALARWMLQAASLTSP